MKPMLMMLALLLTACPVRMIDEPPCRACREECDDSGCDDCRAEHCPDATPSDAAMGAPSVNEPRGSS